MPAPVQHIHQPHHTKQVFNSVSRSYDWVNLIASFGLSGLLRYLMVQRLPSHPATPHHTLDLMCGMGEAWRHIFRRAPHTHITAVDFSQHMLAGARLLNHKQFSNRVVILEDDVLQSGLQSASFDCVVCAFGLKSFSPSQLGSLARLTHRVLKPGGQLVFIDTSIPPSIIVRTLFLWHITYIIPFLGGLTGNRQAFSMLARYTRTFGNARQALQLFAAQGLVLTYHSYLMGIATGFHGHKPHAGP